MSEGYVVVYGGNGALGTASVFNFKANNYWVSSIDFHENPEADLNILVREEDSLAEQETKVMRSMGASLGESKLDAIVCVAGGWAGGNAKEELIGNSDLMWRQSVWPSLISASLAANHLKEGGLLTLPGARAALGNTPDMIGYGMAKAAVHHLAKSLAEKGGGLPEGAAVVAILPVILDTPHNRLMQPEADVSNWTPLDFVTELFLEWTKGKNRPANGTLLQLVTGNFKTDALPV